MTLKQIDAMEKEIAIFYRSKICNTIYHILKQRFNLIDLEVEQDNDGAINISFKNDGEHDKGLVFGYMEQIKLELLSYNIK